MKNNKDFDKIFDGVIFNNAIEAEFYKTASIQELNEMESMNDKVLITLNMLEKISLRRSTCAFPIIFIDIALRQQNINAKNINGNTKKNILIALLDIFFKVYARMFEDNTFKTLSSEVKDYIEIISKSKKSNFTYEINFDKINSTFFDYYALKEFARAIKQLDSKVLKLFKNQFHVILTNIKNALTLRNQNKNDLENKKAHIINQGSLNFSLFLNSQILELLMIAQKPIDDINSKLFFNTFTDEKILELIVAFETSSIDNLKDEVFERLEGVFPENAFSTRTEMLYLHEIFLKFKHPMAITEIDEEYFENTNENSTKESLEQKKIRIVKRLVKKS